MDENEFADILDEQYVIIIGNEKNTEQDGEKMNNNMNKSKFI